MARSCRSNVQNRKEKWFDLFLLEKSVMCVTEWQKSRCISCHLTPGQLGSEKDTLPGAKRQSAVSVMVKC